MYARTPDGSGRYEREREGDEEKERVVGEMPIVMYARLRTHTMHTAAAACMLTQACSAQKGISGRIGRFESHYCCSSALSLVHSWLVDIVFYVSSNCICV